MAQVKLTENQLHDLIAESIKRVLKEDIANQENNTIEQINSIIGRSGCDSWELNHQTTLYLSDRERREKGYDCITYYRGGYGYPEMCFVKEKLEGNNYGPTKHRVGYATPEEFLSILKTQQYVGGAWRNQEELSRRNEIFGESKISKIVSESIKKVLKLAPEN